MNKPQTFQNNIEQPFFSSRWTNIYWLVVLTWFNHLEKYESIGRMTSHIYMKWKIIQLCLKPPISIYIYLYIIYPIKYPYYYTTKYTKPPMILNMSLCLCKRGLRKHMGMHGSCLKKHPGLKQTTLLWGLFFNGGTKWTRSQTPKSKSPI